VLGIKEKVSIDAEFNTGNLIKGLQDALVKALLVMKTVSDSIETALRSIATNIISSFGEALGTAIASGDVSKVFRSLGAEIGGVIEQLGEKMIVLSPLIQAIEVAIKSLNPALLLPAGLALVTLGSAIKAAFAGQKFAGGGIVPGSGNGDTVPAMLTPGEWVVKKSEVPDYLKFRKLFGGSIDNLMGRMASGVQMFANGGPVLPSLNTRIAAPVNVPTLSNSLFNIPSLIELRAEGNALVGVIHTTQKTQARNR
jgi:hypothetical protein